MAKRVKLNNQTSRKLFTRTAKKIHPKNGMTVMRGGIRL